MKISVLVLMSVLLLTAMPADAQKAPKKFDISGRVTDASDRPVSGALIMIDGQNSNIVTDENGMYKVRVSAKADSITVLTITTGVSSAAINNQTEINFRLKGSAGGGTKFSNQAGQKVDIGYGTVNERDVLTNVSTVDGGKYSTFKDIYEVLKGQPGVMVNGKSIKIQGVTSFQMGTEPLFVVDGMVVSSVDGIMPSQIDNISILKGASTSIYGSRGANGVILINLIKAKK
ncbi:MAG: TonB-dependent receptor plug domain-containing protein [Bacteroidales bacterium]|jgi:TonB-dependent SusC/RagA subfamily outer membrane receptor|nr:TonB-dependent receptor plug domain-containing protein [Bacteroidales bacterium]